MIAFAVSIQWLSLQVVCHVEMWFSWAGFNLLMLHSHHTSSPLGRGFRSFRLGKVYKTYPALPWRWHWNNCQWRYVMPFFKNVFLSIVSLHLGLLHVVFVDTEGTHNHPNIEAVWAADISACGVALQCCSSTSSASLNQQDCSEKQSASQLLYPSVSHTLQ